MVYEIIFKGTLDQDWSGWLGDVELCARQADGGMLTTLRGDLADQAALYGVLDHLRDLNLALVSVNRLPPSEG